MHRLFITIIFILALLIVGVYFLSGSKDATSVSASLSVVEAMGDLDTTGYARAVAPREFVFPADHGPHPRFRTEWWYYTGNLQAKNGRRFGYQFTLFRTALSPDSSDRASGWASNQLYMGHFTISDLENGKFYVAERFSRAANGLAGAQAAPFRVWLEDWTVSDPQMQTDAQIPLMHIDAAQDGAALSLTLTSEKPMVLQGDRGLSQKGAEKGNASYYYSLTRLASSGTVVIGTDSFTVSGNSWMDREWSTSALGKDQVGWDWFSLQFTDGRELMYYQLRKTDGSADRFSKGVLVAADGKTRLLSRENVQLKVTDHWDSPLGGRYPAGWKMRVPTADLQLTIAPQMPGQELDVSVRYWEGSVTIAGSSAGSPLSGFGYVELTGYADEPARGGIER